MSLRITNGMMIDNMLTNINKGLLNLNEYNNKVSSNRQMINLSDDPAGLLSSMTTRLRITSIQRYESNVLKSRSWVEQSETALYDINEILISMKELTIDAMGVKNETDLENISVEIEQLGEHIMQNLNAVVGDKYIFGGFNTTEPPFVKDEATGDVLYNGIDLSQVYNDDGTQGTAYEAVFGTGGTTPADRGEIDQILEFEIGFEMNMSVSFTGIDVVGLNNTANPGTETYNIFQVVEDLVNALNNPPAVNPNDPNHYLSNFLVELDEVRNNVMTKIVEVGTKSSTLELMSERYSVDYINNEAVRSEIEDIDVAEEIMKMKYAETTYQQALAVGARIIQPTLMDFLN